MPDHGAGGPMFESWQGRIFSLKFLLMENNNKNNNNKNNNSSNSLVFGRWSQTKITLAVPSVGKLRDKWGKKKGENEGFKTGSRI